MTTRTIEIQHNQAGTLALFAPGVVPGAKVSFDPGSASGDFEVEFSGASPFGDSDPFSFSGLLTKTILPGATTYGIYPFEIRREGGAPIASNLQLTVEPGGIEDIGFSVSGSGSTMVVHTQQWAPGGSLDVVFDKSEAANDVAQISVVKDNVILPEEEWITLAASDEDEIQTFTLVEKLSFHLESDNESEALGRGESGGTEVVDIIIEPPPGG